MDYAIRKFVLKWKNHGYEKGDTQKFWLQFLRDVLKVSNPDDFIEFEKPVKVKKTTNSIDAYLQDSKVIIEQKSLNKNLDAEFLQSDGTKLTPYEQAQKYIAGLPLDMHPRWIVTSNFAEFYIYDMQTLGEPVKILLEELPQQFHAFEFLIDAEKNRVRREEELSLQAGVIIGKIYDALKDQCINPDSAETLQSLNKLCVRLVFCFYAESAGIFGKHKIFCDYLQKSKSYRMRQDLIELFKVLNTPENLRDPYLSDELKNFPYVNGGLFDGEIIIPQFNFTIKRLLIDEAGEFNWDGISPPIFGAVFESTINSKLRRAGGMHYTSPTNIHKVIDPLFLDALRAEFNAVKSSTRNKNKKLLQLQDKISQLKFFDPACGSGNFLTETFLSLRRLENDILKELFGTQIQTGELIENPVKVSINQFYGVEINDFAVAVAKTALWISELQMIQQTQEIIKRDLDFLPLKSYANIFEGNALRLDWNEIFNSSKLSHYNTITLPNYIMGNPPFSGARIMTPIQKSEVHDVFKGYKNLGNLDYVCCWYKKAADFIQGKKIRCAFVSTNSICQGDGVATLWKPLLKKIHFDFAYRTFKWQSESVGMAAVHCVIIGFSNFQNDAPKIIFDGEDKIVAENINGYLLDAPNIFIERRNEPLCNVPEMFRGNMPVDGARDKDGKNVGGNLMIKAEDYENFIKKEPAAQKFIRPYIGAEEFINGKKRYCLWLVDATPNEIKNMPLVYKRVKAVREFRLNSKREATKKFADTPALFQEIRQPSTNYIALPIVSSENRKYIPMDFLTPEIICTDRLTLIPNAGLYEFGVLTSIVHMAWMRVTCGRLKSDYNYSNSIVYNNFVWCEPMAEQRAKIEMTAQKILDARAKFPDSTLADLYDETLMPPELRRAHAENDAAVMAAYGFRAEMTEAEIVAALMKKYLQLTK